MPPIGTAVNTSSGYCLNFLPIKSANKGPQYRYETTDMINPWGFTNISGSVTLCTISNLPLSIMGSKGLLNSVAFLIVTLFTSNL